jgi:hypothetical protein
MQNRGGHGIAATPDNPLEEIPMSTFHRQRRRVPVLALFLVAATSGVQPVSPAWAAEPAPLTALSPAEATALIKEANPPKMVRVAVTELSPEVAAILAGSKSGLRLDALTSITPEVATALAPHAGELVVGVTELSDEAAAALAKHVGDLQFPNLTSLSSLPLAERIGRQTVVGLESVSRVSPEIARALCPPVDLKDKSLGYRWITIGLTEIHPEAGAAIAASRHGFAMPRLESISAEAAASMSGAFLNMRMWGLRTLAPAEAVALATGGGILDIRGFGPEIRDDTAAAMAELIGRRGTRQIDLNGLEKLSSPALAVAALTKKNNRNGPHGSLGGVSEVTAEVAQALAECTEAINGLPALESFTSAPLAARYASQKEPVILKKLTSIPDDVAAALAAHRGKMDLSGLKSLSVPAAAAFATHEGELSLDGLDEISDEAAEALAKAVGQVSVKRLRNLSPAARAALGSNPKISLAPAQPAP